jgi:CobQ-like glutamine amidotransferase family enzyme
MRSLTVCHLYPDLLNLYGDRGNVIALRRRLEWRGIGAEVVPLSLGERFDPSRFDIVFLGGGQDYEQQIIREDVVTLKGPAIKAAIEDGVVFLGVCGGYQLLGKYYRTWDGVQIDFLGALDLWTVGGKKRMIGNIVFECDFLGGGDPRADRKVVGFENHSGRTFLGGGVAPLGRVLKGCGNNGEDGCEGARYKNVFCTYSHGSVLPKNPAFADHLIAAALERRYPGSGPLPPLDDALEDLAHRTTAKRFG